MRLEEIDAELIKTAVAAFLDRAWGTLAPRHWPTRIDRDTGDRGAVLAAFVDETKRGNMHKYSLRLGNRRYPFMKLLFQEQLYRDAYFFAVDTHDQLDIKETTPDFQEWQAIRNHNAAVKSDVEAEWRRLGVPMLADILEQVDSRPVPPSEICRVVPGPLVYVADDEAAIADGVRRILVRRGYRVELFPSAEACLAAIARKQPDLVISDLEMGEGLSGLQFCERLRGRESTAAIPFILATAAGLALDRLNLVDGFLVKPYEIEVLVEFVRQHLGDD